MVWKLHRFRDYMRSAGNANILNYRCLKLSIFLKLHFQISLNIPKNIIDLKIQMCVQNVKFTNFLGQPVILSDAITHELAHVRSSRFREFTALLKERKFKNFLHVSEMTLKAF